MRPSLEQLLSDVQNVLDDLEGLMLAAREEKRSGTHAADDGVIEARVAKLQSALGRFRERLGEHLERRANAADRYVRDHAWKLLGVAAVFVLGMLISRRD